MVRVHPTNADSPEGKKYFLCRYPKPVTQISVFLGFNIWIVTHVCCIWVCAILCYIVCVLFPFGLATSKSTWRRGWHRGGAVSLLLFGLPGRILCNDQPQLVQSVNESLGKICWELQGKTQKESSLVWCNPKVAWRTCSDSKTGGL